MDSSPAICVEEKKDKFSELLLTDNFLVLRNGFVQLTGELEKWYVDNGVEMPNRKEMFQVLRNIAKPAGGLETMLMRKFIVMYMTGDAAKKVYYPQIGASKAEPFTRCHSHVHECFMRRQIDATGALRRDSSDYELTVLAKYVTRFNPYGWWQETENECKNVQTLEK